MFAVDPAHGPARGVEAVVERMLPLVVAGIAMLAGWVVFVAVRSVRSARRELRDAVRSLGFTPVEPDDGLTARLAALYSAAGGNGRSGPADYRLEHVYGKRIADGDMYLFDLVDTSGDGSTRTEQQAVAVVSPHLQIPPFVLIPRIGAGSAFASLANRMVSWMASRYGTVVDLSHDPVFSKHYLVSSREPDAARRFLTTGRTRRLAEIRYANLHAGGSVFVVSTFRMGRQPVRQTLGERIDHASRLLSVFSMTVNER